MAGLEAQAADGRVGEVHHGARHGVEEALVQRVMGRLYRTVVIGTGGHRLVVGRLLRAVERRTAD